MMTYKNDEWNPWTEKSADVSFTSSVKEIGDGEEKLAMEYGIKPLGQNFSYDLQMPFDEKWECKKIDSDNSFRIGVEVTSLYTHIISKVISIFEKIIQLEDSLLDTEHSAEIKKCILTLKYTSKSCKTSLLNGLKKNEVSNSNLMKANIIIETIKKYIIMEDTKVSLFSSFDGKEYEYSILSAFTKLSLEPIPNEDKYMKLGGPEMYNKLLLTNTLGSDIHLFLKFSLCEILNETVRSVFKDKKLVLVDEEKGYKPVTDMTKLICNRITSGRPRCKYL